LLRASPHLIIPISVENNFDRRTITFIVTKHEFEAGLTQQIVGGVAPPTPIDTLLHPPSNILIVWQQYSLTVFCPPSPIPYPFISSKEIWRELTQHGSQNGIVPQSVGRDWSITETDVDSHEHTTRRMIYTRFDFSTGHIVKMPPSGNQLSQFIYGQRTSTRRQKCSDVDRKIRLEESFNILLIDLLLSNRRRFK